ncbi:conserved hypothetical protein [Talaromyces stipitatus ATCC 10500]|uniref:Acyltransferase 3 domain-containing protein n=1 Tax=Talaromyces stipitatus (strain ATCC 10500 / CBS 375.48 / QM 6759 / NRRL 1006) TaxID=441959 RepID=B8MJV9_TALSN|nr:uncharacterized protein TSTA_042500 [Talaromyces stipitatus ATCC 10500]EED14776.1 conserved hypothetical protein [Talaromyces stipitatus ATCC 10500]
MVGLDLKLLRKHIVTPPTKYEQEYLIGFRGLLVIQAFLWMFLQTFAPSTVYASYDVGGPHAQVIVRKVFSVLFWNEYFLYGAFIFLSARSIAIPYFRDPTPAVIARSLLTRSLQLCIPVAICLAIVKGSITANALNTIKHFKYSTNNLSLPIPYQFPNALSYWNSVFNLFWTTHGFRSQSGSYAFPTQTLWMINAVYIQSYTVYMIMVIVPYTRPQWRVQFGILFVIAAWWCNSWAWYTVSGVLVCDMVMHMDLKQNALMGIPVQYRSLVWRSNDGKPRRIPTWFVGGLLLVGGLLMQYLWAAYRPDLFFSEWRIHSNPYTTGGLDERYLLDHISARDDVYITILGIFILLETYDVLQRVLQNKFLLFLGRRALSYFLLQSIFAYIVGIRVFEGLRSRHVPHDGAVMVALITCIAVTVPAAELFHRLIVVPSRYLSHNFYEFITS